jgi:hypothetical protein
MALLFTLSQALRRSTGAGACSTIWFVVKRARESVRDR